MSMGIVEDIRAYQPWNEQEEADKARILAFIAANENAFLRENSLAHMTASAWITDPSRQKLLMVYHRIYDSWSWTGGHADGEEDLLAVAMREAMEETGLQSVRPVSPEIYSLEVLTVDGHQKRGKYVPSHLHMNVSYLLQADPSQPLKVCPQENSGVKWFDKEAALKASSEPWFVERIYKKLNEKLELFPPDQA